MKRRKIENRQISCKTLKNGTQIWYRENSSDMLMYKENPYKNIDLREDDVLMDIGANMGDIPLRMAKKVKTIHSYEPMPDTFEILKLNVEQNGFKNCEIHQAAITTFNGEISIFLNEKAKNAHSAASIVKLRGERAETIVPALSFSDEVKRISPSIIKMDIEGAEIDILNEVPDSVFEGSRMFLLEVHLYAIKKEDPEEWNRKIGERFKRIYGSAEEEQVFLFNKKTCIVWKFQKS